MEANRHTHTPRARQTLCPSSAFFHWRSKEELTLLILFQSLSENRRMGHFVMQTHSYKFMGEFLEKTEVKPDDTPAKAPTASALKNLPISLLLIGTHCAVS